MGAHTASLLNDMDTWTLRMPMVVATVLIFTPVSVAYCDNIMIMLCRCNSLSWQLY